MDHFEYRYVKQHNIKLKGCIYDRLTHDLSYSDMISLCSVLCDLLLYDKHREKIIFLHIIYVDSRFNPRRIKLRRIKTSTFCKTI